MLRIIVCRVIRHAATYILIMPLIFSDAISSCDVYFIAAAAMPPFTRYAIRRRLIRHDAAYAMSPRYDAKARRRCYAIMIHYAPCHMKMLLLPRYASHADC